MFKDLPAEPVSSLQMCQTLLSRTKPLLLTTMRVTVCLLGYDAVRHDVNGLMFQRNLLIALSDLIYPNAGGSGYVRNVVTLVPDHNALNPSNPTHP
jgi:hypothetical protein